MYETTPRDYIGRLFIKDELCSSPMLALLNCVVIKFNMAISGFVQNTTSILLPKIDLANFYTTVLAAIGLIFCSF